MKNAIFNLYMEYIFQNTFYSNLNKLFSNFAVEISKNELSVGI